MSLGALCSQRNPSHVQVPLADSAQTDDAVSSLQLRCSLPNRSDFRCYASESGDGRCRAEAISFNSGKTRISWPYRKFDPERFLRGKAPKDNFQDITNQLLGPPSQMHRNILLAFLSTASAYMVRPLFLGGAGRSFGLMRSFDNIQPHHGITGSSKMTMSKVHRTIDTFSNSPFIRRACIFNAFQADLCFFFHLKECRWLFSKREFGGKYRTREQVIPVNEVGAYKINIYGFNDRFLAVK